jgi:hypothetical protein
LLGKDAATHRWHTSSAVRAREPKTRLVSARDAARAYSVPRQSSRHTGRPALRQPRTVRLALGSAAAVAPHAPDVDPEAKTSPGGRLRDDAPPKDGKGRRRLASTARSREDRMRARGARGHGGIGKPEPAADAGRGDLTLTACVSASASRVVRAKAGGDGADAGRVGLRAGNQ